MAPYQCSPRFGEFLLSRLPVSDLPHGWCSAGSLLCATVSESLTHAFEQGFSPMAERCSMLCRAGYTLGIRHLLDATVAELSPAERHRVELVCALVYAPPLLVVQEPPLAPHERVVHLFRWLQSGHGLTTLWVAPSSGACAGPLAGD